MYGIVPECHNCVCAEGNGVEGSIRVAEDVFSVESEVESCVSRGKGNEETRARRLVREGWRLFGDVTHFGFI